MNFYTDNIKRGWFTKDGAFYLLTRGYFLSNVYCDSLLTTWKISTQEIQTVTANITGNAQIGGTLLLGGTITIDGANSRISSTSGNIDFDANNLTTTGNISAGNLNATGGVSASGLTVNGSSLFSGSATFNSGLNATQISAGALSVSGTTTLHTVVLNDGVTMPPLAGSGKGLIQFNNSGQLTRLNFTSDTNDILTGNGTFRNISLLVPLDTGWQWVGSNLISTANDVYVPNSLFVGKSLNIGPFKIKNGGATDTIRTPVALALISDAQNINLGADTVRMPKYLEAPNIRSVQLQVAGDAVISNNLSVGGYMTIGTAKMISNGSYRDTLRTPKELALISDANLIKLEADTVRMTQLVKAGKIATPEGRIDTLSSKEVRTARLLVSGDIEAVNGTVRSNEVTTNTITANDLTVNTQFSSPRIITSRITSPDSLIHFGDSSINYNLTYNRIWGSGSVNGIALGQYATGTGQRTVAIGTSVQATAGQSIVIGSGVGSTLLNNTKNNSLVVGFNSNIPTLFVGASDGIETTGNVGIGTLDPSEKLEVNGNIRINENDIFFRSDVPDGNHGIGWYGISGSKNKPFAGVNVDGPVIYGYDGGALGVNMDGTKKVVLRWTNDNRVGIGRSTFIQAKLHVDADAGMIGLFVTTDFSTNYGYGIMSSVSGDATRAFAAENRSTGQEVFEVWGDGRVYATDLTIKTTPFFPDYVFSKNYKRPNWIEKKNFYEKNNHLMYMESGTDIEKKGFTMSKNLTGLTRNVEEISLDVNDLYEIVLTQKREIEQLKKKIEEMERNK